MILEIGPADSGKTWEDSVTLDCIPRPHVDVVATWGRQNLPMRDNLFSFVYASHVIEHIPWYLTESALREAYRVLTPCGRLEIWTVDFEIVLKTYSSRKITDDWTPFNDEQDPIKWVAGRLFCGTRQNEESSWHRALFDEIYLMRCLESVGFKGVRRLEKQPKEQRVNHETVNLGMTGVK